MAGLVGEVTGLPDVRRFRRQAPRLDAEAARAPVRRALGGDRPAEAGRRLGDALSCQWRHLGRLPPGHPKRSPTGAPVADLPARLQQDSAHRRRPEAAAPAILHCRS
eukprot:10516001-Heterocapsa_arctica.AAC.1